MALFCVLVPKMRLSTTCFRGAKVQPSQKLRVLRCICAADCKQLIQACIALARSKCPEVVAQACLAG